MKKKISLIVKDNENNVRVDVFINKREFDLSRTRIKNLILNKNLRINNEIINDPSKKVSYNDNISLIIPEPKKASLKPYPRSSISKNQPPTIFTRYIKANVAAQSKQKIAINAILSCFSIFNN